MNATQLTKSTEVGKLSILLSSGQSALWHFGFANLQREWETLWQNITRAYAA